MGGRLGPRAPPRAGVEFRAIVRKASEQTLGLCSRDPGGGAGRGPLASNPPDRFGPELPRGPRVSVPPARAGFAPRRSAAVPGPRPALPEPVGMPTPGAGGGPPLVTATAPPTPPRPNRAAARMNHRPGRAGRKGARGRREGPISGDFLLPQAWHASPLLSGDSRGN